LAEPLILGRGIGCQFDSDPDFPAALKHVSADRLIPAPDCGMKYLKREVAFGKLKALAEGAAMVRREIA
jgi:hypothetical protein